MSTENKPKSLGQAIDEVIAALDGLDATSRPIVIKAACEHLKIEGFGNAAAGQNQGGGAVVTTGGGAGNGSSLPASGAPLDIKTLKTEKQPGSAVEMACIVGFYLQNVAPPEERKAAIEGEDVDKYFRQAGYPLPKAKGQLLVDAKSSGYFDSAGRGAYRLNAVGYNLVAHSLPRGAKAKK
jgi:hypothetical protein